jgi:protein gp37
LAETTGISWTDATFNPFIGCTAVSAGCDHCYAKTLVERWGGDFATRRRTSPANWRGPLKWNRQAESAGVRRRVFCASLADVFDNQVPEQWRDDLWALILFTPWLDWQLLTKRPQNIAKMLPATWGRGWQNVWLGTTVENQEEADRRIPHLVAVPARVHFLSCEPLLGPLNLWRWIGVHHHPDNDLSSPESRVAMTAVIRATRRMMGGEMWVIAGSESGPGRRACDLSWVKNLRDQCASGGVPFHWKQHVVDGKVVHGPYLEGRQWLEFPA